MSSEETLGLPLGAVGGDGKVPEELRVVALVEDTDRRRSHGPLHGDSPLDKVDVHVLVEPVGVLPLREDVGRGGLEPAPEVVLDELVGVHLHPFALAQPAQVMYEALEVDRLGAGSPDLPEEALYRLVGPDLLEVPVDCDLLLVAPLLHAMRVYPHYLPPLREFIQELSSFCHEEAGHRYESRGCKRHKRLLEGKIP